MNENKTTTTTTTTEKTKMSNKNNTSKINKIKKRRVEEDTKVNKTRPQLLLRLRLLLLLG